MVSVDEQWAERLREEWQAVPEDTVGGWCVVLKKERRTPAEGAPVIVYFAGKSEAFHVARIHNWWREYVLQQGRELDDDSDTQPPPGRAPES